MNKKYIIMTALAAMALVSCDMDKEPYNSLPDSEALQTPRNFQSAAVGLYSGLRSSIMGTFYNAPEIQCDGFHAVTGFSNTYGDMYRWTFDSQTTSFETVYANYEAVISRANYIIDGYNGLKADGSFDNKNVFPDRATSNNPGMPGVRKAKGEAFFSRAYCLFGLAQYFCAAYDPATAENENTGVSYTLTYAPSSDHSTYPGRTTLAKTYKQIYDDLDSAALYITTAGQANNDYISVDAITALRARVALAKGDYDLALEEAELLINSGAYTLASGVEQLAYLWQTSATWNNGGGGNETIFLLCTASSSELPAATGTIYLPYSAGSSPDYIPTQTLVDLFSENDYRKPVYFTNVDIVTSTGGVGTVLALNKYMDKGVLYQATGYSESARFCIEPRVFRIAEMYLIAAEAYAQTGDLTSAGAYLNYLQQRRIEGFARRTYTDLDTFMAELMKERQRELLAEGSRLFDIKRWHIAMNRGDAQQRDLCLLPGSGTTGMSVPADDNRLTWPIPKHEMDVNPNMKQNPGY